MLLHDLLHRYNPSIALDGVPEVPVTGVCEDSRAVHSGSLFVARAGTKTDGGKFAVDAAARGAVAVLTESPIPDLPIPQIQVTSAADALARLAHLFHNQPADTVKVIGITGTNGKTTTAYLVRHLLHTVEQRCGLIGTVEIDDGVSTRRAAMTTPGPCELAGLLATMRDNACRRCAMEVSSHALHQNRTAGLWFSAAGFTNLTWDHMDYHGTIENYAAAKAMLFESLEHDAVAIVNGDSQWAETMVRKCRAKVVRFGFGPDSDYQAQEVSISSEGSSFLLTTPEDSARIRMRLVGKHNVENALLAAALVMETFGLSAMDVSRGLRDAAGAPGRLQPVHQGQPFSVLVDYAHTDDALKNVLSALRPLTRGKLRVLFGCGGDRDARKRPLMAKVAEQLADVVYVTSDNPRTEQPESILNQIAAGFSRVKPVFREVDRRAAIEQAIRDAEPGDIVLLAGKGHENYQIVGSERRHFDDVEEARKVLSSL